MTDEDFQEDLFDIHGWLLGIEINRRALPHDDAVAALQAFADAANLILEANPFIQSLQKKQQDTSSPRCSHGEQSDGGDPQSTAAYCKIFVLTGPEYCPSMIDARNGQTVAEIDPHRPAQSINNRETP